MWFVICGWPHAHWFEDQYAIYAHHQHIHLSGISSAWTHWWRRSDGQMVESDIKVWLSTVCCVRCRRQILQWKPWLVAVCSQRDIFKFCCFVTRVKHYLLSQKCCIQLHHNLPWMLTVQSSSSINNVNVFLQPNQVGIITVNFCPKMLIERKAEATRLLVFLCVNL